LFRLGFENGIPNYEGLELITATIIGMRIHVSGTDHEGLDWFHKNQDSVQWWPLADTKMNLQTEEEEGNFFTI
jgi:hypothetical protein